MKPGDQALESGQRVPTTGTKRLTEREMQILELVAKGLENKEIADQMNLSISLTQKLVRRAFRKLGVSRRADAVAAWIKARAS